MCSPKTQFKVKEDVLTAIKNAPFSVTVLLYVIQKKVGKGLNFSMDSEAEECFDQIYKLCNGFRAKSTNSENYLWYKF